MPIVNVNIEGLRMHCSILIFSPEDHLSEAQRRWRSWFVHTLLSAARHYEDARNVVLHQIESDKTRKHSSLLPILDFGEFIEDCVGSLNRLCMCTKYLEAEVPSFAQFRQHHTVAIEKLRNIRNEQEHLYNKIGQEDDSGPIVYSISNNEAGVDLRTNHLEFSAIHELIVGAFEAITSMFPDFNKDSEAEKRGTTSLSATFSITEHKA
jgi:hypothetical protein